MGGPCDCDGKTHEFMDNFYRCTFKDAAGIEWPSSEHHYQAAKFPEAEDDAIREQIRTSPGGMDAWRRGNDHGREVQQYSKGGPTIRKDWETAKVDAMYQANWLKYSQSEYLKTALTRTNGSITARGGLFWKTWNEIILERIREELRLPAEQDRHVLNVRKAMMENFRQAMLTEDSYLADAITQQAAKREVVDTSLLDKPLRIEGLDKIEKQSACAWMRATFRPDLRNPVVNGEPHYFNEGGHLYLGKKHGKYAWVLDEVVDANEVTGTAYLPVEQGRTSLDLLGKACAWSVFMGRAHLGVELIVK
eukprot:TRINITY_DN2413_c0_g1_i1.p1 TRINITY_DN2413_c0_g1~~TRINITY_DN2413_c0_g1_i1.p1  ORF type:complete len:323 (+),score=52.51 TRINITY_DN2413_c0_g1_i1:54-971(+)